MARNMSFMLTTEQVVSGTKTVTRRLGWATLRPGTIVNACRKCMGLQPGERVEVLRPVRIVSVRREPLQALIDDPEYGAAEAAREGFPHLDGAGFVAMFCEHMAATPATVVTRIEFAYDGSASQMPDRQARLF